MLIRYSSGNFLSGLPSILMSTVSGKKSKHLDEFVHVRGNSFKLTVLNVLDFIDKKPL